MAPDGDVVTTKAEGKAMFVQLTGDGPGQAGADIGAGQVALVPGALVPLLELDLPRGLRGEAREQVARRQLRDQLGLGEDALQMRPFHVPGQPDSWTRVLVADPARIARWRQAAGPARAVLPDYLGLPTARGLWTVRGGAGDAVLVRLGPGDGFSAPSDIARAMLARALETAAPEDRPRALLQLGAPLPAIAALAEAQGLPLVETPEAAAALGLPLPRVLAHGEAGFDLRRDPQAARNRLRAQVLPWRWPLLAGALAAALWAATQFLTIQSLHSQIADTRNAALALTRAHFIPEGPILDMRVQIARRLAELQAATGDPPEYRSPVEPLAVAAAHLVAQGARLDEISLTSEAGLHVTLRLADFAAIDRLTEVLSARGLTVELGRSQAVGGQDGVSVDLRLALDGPDGGRP